MKKSKTYVITLCLLAVVFITTASIGILMTRKEDTKAFAELDNIVSSAEPVKVILKGYTDAQGSFVKSREVNFDVEPQIIDSRTMLPVRAITEELGYTVDWNADERKITITGVFGSDDIEDKASNSASQYLRTSDVFLKLDSGESYDNISNYHYQGSFRPALIDVIESNKVTVEEVLYIDNNKATVRVSKYGETDGFYFDYTMDVPPQIVDNRTLIPVRAVVEMLGLQVDWDDSTRTVSIIADNGFSES